MTLRRTGLLALAFILLTGAPPVLAADELFTVRGVAVDRTAASADQAKTLALGDGQRQAFFRLIGRLAFSGAGARLAHLDDPSIAGLVESFGVESEKTSAVRYIASLTVSFSPSRVRDLLRREAIAFAETPSKPVLVLPVLSSGGAFSLWDEPNPWRDAWAALQDHDGLVPLVLPLGDLADIAAISARQAVDGNDDRLAAIAARYGASDTLVVVAAPRFGSSGTGLHLTISRFGPGQVGDVVVDTVDAGDRAGLAAAYDRAVSRVVRAAEESWKAAVAVGTGSGGTLPVTVRFETLAAWAAMERRLRAVAAVRQVTLQSFSLRDAEARLLYVGSEAQLALALAQSDIVLGPPDAFGRRPLSLRGSAAP
ncbi:MAG: DUF2066 domain-containing protein [Alphaproteobacteria bacterium]